MKCSSLAGFVQLTIYLGWRYGEDLYGTFHVADFRLILPWSLQVSILFEGIYSQLVSSLKNYKLRLYPTFM